MDFPVINGFGHIDLTVTDGERSVRWCEQILGFTLVGKSEHAGLPTRIADCLIRSASSERRSAVLGG